MPALALEGLANRNSLSYLPTYGLDPKLPTILRGTLRYRGFARLMSMFQSLGLLDSRPLESAISVWTELLDYALARDLNCAVRSDDRSRMSMMADAVSARADGATVEEVKEAMQWCAARIRRLGYTHECNLIVGLPAQAIFDIRWH